MVQFVTLGSGNTPIHRGILPVDHDRLVAILENQYRKADV